jgi:hypothetical protein
MLIHMLVANCTVGLPDQQALIANALRKRGVFCKLGNHIGILVYN